MTPDELIPLRKSAWERLSSLTTRARHNRLSSLSESELIELGQLYRDATADLAIAQRDFPRHDVARFLNQLVGSAHGIVYRGEPLVLARLKAFYLRDFPRLYRHLAPFMIISAVLTFLPAVLAFFALRFDPANAPLFLQPQLIEYGKTDTQWWRDLNDANQVGAAEIMTHNLQVSFLAFAGGLPFGILTVYVLVTNGLSLGAVFGLLGAYGHARPLAEFVIGHGVLELNEIVMAGAAGLMMAYALLRPGLLSRRNALTQAAGDAIKLALGSAPLLVVAGLIEGFISPSEVIPFAVKAAIGIGTGVALYAYLFLAARYAKVRDNREDIKQLKAALAP